jgi:Ca-activated chloride channel homolog
VAAFWRKVGRPVLADVAFAWDGAKVDEVYPRPVADLYLGSQMVLVGRYRSGGEARLTLSGKVNGETRSYSFPGLRFTDMDTDKDYIPRLWANRKVGDLLSEVRRNGTNKELIDEIVALSQRFGIATPYTSFFVNEPGSPGVAQAPMSEQKAADQVARNVASAPASGPSAVEGAQKVQQIRGAESLAQAQPQGDAAGQIRMAGAKTFILRGGIWTDTAYQGGDLLSLKLGSDRYLQLVRTRPDLARYLAVGSPLILADGAVAYGIDIPGKEESEAALPPPPLPPGGRSGSGRLAAALWLGGGAGAAGALALTGLWMRRKRTA